MSTYRVRFTTTAEVTVTIDSEDADLAADEAWPIAEAYLETLTPDWRGTAIHASLDGIGAEDVAEVSR